MPAARRVARSGWKSSRQPDADVAHELLTTSGASGVAGLPSGSSSHWNPWWIPVEVAIPRSLNILTAIHVASGATPTELPPASPPTITPIVQVPWPLTSTGVVGCCPFGSYQLLVPPRQRLARSGWVTSTPVSMFATTIPWPRYPRFHSAGALTRATFVSAGADVAAVGVGGADTARLGRISRTSWRAASSLITAGVAVTAMALMIHNG